MVHLLFSSFSHNTVGGTRGVRRVNLEKAFFFFWLFLLMRPINKASKFATITAVHLMQANNNLYRFYKKKKSCRSEKKSQQMASTVSGGATELALAKRLHALTKEYRNRPVVARRNTVPTLLKLLVNKQRDVRFTAAEALAFLCDHPENVEYMCQEKGFLPVVYEQYRSAECDDPEMYHVLGSIFDHLRAALDDSTNAAASSQKEPGPAAANGLTPRPDRSSETGTPRTARSTTSSAPPTGQVGGGLQILSGSATNRADGESARIAKHRSTRVLRGVMSAPARNVVIEITDADDASVPELEELFQTTRGVISYSTNPQSRSGLPVGGRRFGIYMTTATTTLLNILADAGFKATVVEEVVVQRSNNDQENSEPPQQQHQSHFYTSSGSTSHQCGGENGSASGGVPQSYFGSIRNFASQFYRSAMVPHGVDSATLAARHKQQKEEAMRTKMQKEKSQINDFISKITVGWW